jgi:hypothetical protein
VFLDLAMYGTMKMRLQIFSALQRWKINTVLRMIRQKKKHSLFICQTKLSSLKGAPTSYTTANQSTALRPKCIISEESMVRQHI